VFAALIVMPEPFIRMFAGKAGAGAAGVVTILAIGNIFYTGTGPTGYVISMTGRPGVNFVNSIVAVGLYVGLGALIVPEHGAVGMAVVDSVVTAVLNLARVVEAWVLVGVQPFGKTFVKPVLATLAGSAVLLAWRLAFGTGTLIALLGVAIAAVVYLGALRVQGLDEEELLVWKQIRRRAFKRRSRR
jgi:O-antigen/teichoic acid export membrane protein